MDAHKLFSEKQNQVTLNIVKTNYAIPLKAPETRFHME